MQDKSTTYVLHKSYNFFHKMVQYCADLVYNQTYVYMITKKNKQDKEDNNEIIKFCNSML